jgi:hypothetical protein
MTRVSMSQSVWILRTLRTWPEGFALHPELVAGAAIEGDVAGFARLAPGFFIHEADHEDATGLFVLDDGG